MAEAIKNKNSENKKTESPLIFASSPMMKGSVMKVNDVCKLIRGIGCEEALNRLSFISRSPAYNIKKTLMSCIANARHNFKISTKSLIVSKVDVFSVMCLKRRICAGRGRSGMIRKKYSKVRIYIDTFEKKSDKSGK